MVVLAGCGGSGDEEPAAPTTTEAAPTTTEETDGGSAVPDTPLTTTLDEGYTVVNGTPSEPDPADLPVQPGTVEAHWFKSGENWVVVYVDVPESARPLCPGNSLLIADFADDVSNSPVGDGACGTSANLATDPAGAQECGSLIVYVTAIPASKEGVLTSTIEVWEDDTTIHGVTGFVSSETGEAPEVELSDLGC
jgi:hypothetical protein